MTTPATITPPAFPEKTAEPNTVSVDLPNVLKGVDSHSGRDVLTIINGGRQQVSMLSEHWLSDDPVPPPPIFAILGRNMVSCGGQPVAVINDGCTINGKLFSATSPTATQYFAQVGKQVFVRFSCDIVKPDSALSTIYRGAKFGNLGEPLYAIRQTSFVLP